MDVQKATYFAQPQSRVQASESQDPDYNLEDKQGGEASRNKIINKYLIINFLVGKIIYLFNPFRTQLFIRVSTKFIN